MAKIIFSGGGPNPQAEAVFLEESAEKETNRGIMFRIFYATLKLGSTLFPEKKDPLWKKTYKVGMPLSKVYNSISWEKKATLFIASFIFMLLPASIIYTGKFLVTLVLLLQFICIASAAQITYSLSVLVLTEDNRNKYMAEKIDEIMKKEDYQFGLIEAGQTPSKGLAKYLAEMGYEVEAA
jgi:hypothetical protein